MGEFRSALEEGWARAGRSGESFDIAPTVTARVDAGPADLVRDRMRACRHAGVGTLILSPMAWTLPDRIEQLRAIADLAP